MPDYDLLLTGGTVLDPSAGGDAAGPRTADVAIAGDKIAAVGLSLPRDRAARAVDVSGRLVTPGLIDLHTHVYWGGTSLGVDPDALSASSGVTTHVDAGSSGPGNFAGFRRHLIERSRVRILPFLNISFAGIFAFSRRVMVGESIDMRLLNVQEAVDAGREHRDLVLGMKVRLGLIAGEGQGLPPLHHTLQAAEALGVRMMVHTDNPPPTRREVLPLLRKGDILTHAFRPFPNGPTVDPGVTGRILPELWEARERGVVIDIGHGMGSFSFESAEACLAQGFLPDVISSDVHALCINGPAYDLPTTMSKLLSLGMPLDRVIAAATVAPARAIGRPDLGTLRPGSPADVTVLHDRTGAFEYLDVTGRTMTGRRRLVPVLTVTGGQILEPRAASDVRK
ncbi:MAG TPA: amidohydrolase/deacetylase family metallohydrolase [bacterium]|nr:amidohydrolase/deacetylase family metallohydrolase [bacterium]